MNPERARKAQYGIAVFKGVIVKVYEILNWIPAPTLPLDSNFVVKSKINRKKV